MTITNKYKLFILYFWGTWGGICVYAETFADSIAYKIPGQVAMNDFQNFLQYNTFLLPGIENRPFTKGEACLSFNEGDFYSPLETGGRKEAQVNVSSLLKVKHWNLFGAFSYSNQFSGKSRSALMYPVNYDVNPLFLFQKHSSSWNIQQYHFRVMGSTALGKEKRYTLGARGHYRGIAAYKRTDIRNDQVTLDLTVGAGIGHSLNAFWKIGLDIDYNWVKTIPDLGMVYFHKAGDIEFRNYMNVGLGTSITLPGYQFKVMDSKPVITLAAVNENKYKRRLFRAGGYYHRQQWSDESISNVGRDNQLYRYIGYNLNASYIYTRKNKGSRWNGSMLLNGLLGRSYYKEGLGAVYKDPYFSRMLQGKLAFVYEKYEDKSVRKVEAALLAEYRSMRDKNFGSHFRIIYFNPEVAAVICFPLSGPFLLELASGMQAYLANSQYDPASSAGTIQSELLGQSYVGYSMSDYISAHMQLAFRVKKKNDCSFFIRGDYSRPLGNIYVNTGTNYLYTLSGGAIIYY